MKPHPEMSRDRAGNLWIGTEDGVFSRLDPQTETFVHYRHKPDDPYSVSRGRMEVIHEDRAGILWIGSQDGLNRFDPQTETFTHYTEKDGLAGE
ncbi:MAG: hypothetical protein GY801_15025 [bacterium]|nr:hypothetical protein [bacterium]